MSPRHPNPSNSKQAFSLLELLIVASLCAVVFTSAALAYRAVSLNLRRSSAFQTVSLPATTVANFFPGTTGTTVDSYTTPNYTRAALASQMRNLFYEDVESSNAVFALPRAGNINSIRERIITVGSVQPAAYDTPAGFLSLLLSTPSTTARAAVFTSYRGAPPVTYTTGSGPSAITTQGTNGTIFILQPAGANTEIWLRAVYEIDYIGFTDIGSGNIPCVHASVRRYVNSTLTNFYDVVYRNATTDQVGPPFVHFERAARTLPSTSSNYNKYTVAYNNPFYLMWWPDPSMATLAGTAILTGASPTYAASSLQSDYAKHEGQTSFQFVLPQFPCF